MNVIKEIERLNAQELFKDLSDSASWHAQYQDSAYVFAGGIPFDLNEGDLIAVFSQWGEIVDVYLARDKQTGKSKGFCFLGYEDQRSTILAVDNFNGISLLGRMIRVDHCANYKGERKDRNEDDEEFNARQLEKRRAVVPKHLLPVNERPPEDNHESDNDSETARQLGIDPDDPMREYLITKHKAKRRKKLKKKERKKPSKYSHEEDRSPRKIVYSNDGKR